MKSSKSTKLIVIRGILVINILKKTVIRMIFCD